MNLDTLEPDPAEVVALLQPYVDGELSDEERELVAEQIATQPDFQAIVREQREIQSLLRGLERELAPAALRERITADLDAIEAERQAADERGWFAPVVGRIKAFGKGALLMVPAVAAAGALFFVANNAGWIDGPAGTDHIDGGLAGSLHIGPQAKHIAEPSQPAPPGADTAGSEPEPSLPSAAELSEQGFAVQVAPALTLPSGIALVSDSKPAPGSSASVRYRYGPEVVVVDRQRRAGVTPPSGAAVSFRANEYYLSRDERGRPFVEFRLGAVHHSLTLEGEHAVAGAGVGADDPDFPGLLIVADALRQSHGL